MKISSFRLVALLPALLLGALVITLAEPRAAPAATTGTDADVSTKVTPSPSDSHPSDWDRHETDNDAADRDDTDLDADRGESSDRDKHPGARRHRHLTFHRDNELVNVGGDSMLEAGKEAESVVSVFGDTRVEGTVLDGVIAVFGNDYVDGKVGGDVVSVFGNVQLGPHADIDGDVSSVFGKVRRDPSAIVHGDLNSVFAHDFAAPNGLRTWIDNCLILGRPLSLANGLGWAWSLALALLVLYLGIALVFRDAVTRCAETFETQPGHSVLAALLAVLLTPVVIALLCITIVGIAAVPFVVIGLFCLALFGKTVILAWLGRRILSVRDRGAPGVSVTHPALAVMLGGLVALALYLVPYLGFAIYKLLGFLGFGAVVYAAIQALQARQTSKRATVDAQIADGGAAAATMAGASPTRDAYAASGVPPDAASAAAVAPAASVDLPRAGFWIRMLALLLDVVLVGLVVSLVRGYSHMHLVLLATYGAIMWKLRGATVGGIVFNLSVVRVDGRAMDWETSIIRALSCFLSLAVAGLGFFWIAFDAANQAWHDKIAGTVVVRLPKVVPRT